MYLSYVALNTPFKLIDVAPVNVTFPVVALNEPLPEPTATLVGMIGTIAPALVMAVFICAVVEYAVKSVCAEASSCHAVPSYTLAFLAN